MTTDEHREECIALAAASTDAQLGGMVTAAVGVMIHRFGRERGVTWAKELIDVVDAHIAKEEVPRDPA